MQGHTCLPWLLHWSSISSWSNLPETAYHRDQWVHGMFYEIVSKMLLTSLLLMWLCVIRLLHVVGEAYIHGHNLPLLPTFAVLISVLSKEHPCDLAVGNIAADFRWVIQFSADLQPQQEEMWWQRDLRRVTFPAATVGGNLCPYNYLFNCPYLQIWTHQENQTAIIVNVQEVMNANIEWANVGEAITNRKTSTIERMLSIVSHAPEESV